MLQRDVEAHVFAEAHFFHSLGFWHKGDQIKAVKGRSSVGECDMSCSWGQGRRSFGWKHLKANLSWRKPILGLKEEEEGDFEKRIGFHLSSSPIFLLFLIFYGCVFPFHELISFSRVLM